jgi:hypothetical protein
MGEKLSKPLYELRPDLCPHGRLTDVELGLWDRYFRYKDEQTKQTVT